MNQIRQILISPILFYLIIYCVLACWAWKDLHGKFPQLYRARRIAFDKRHPGLNKKFTIITLFFISILVVVVMSTLALDFVEEDVQTVEGAVNRKEIGKFALESSIVLEDGSSLSVWLNNPKIEVQKEYIFQYAKRSKIIINVFPCD
jgi:hypothetical protein